jgi:hypothetical protein
VTPKQVVVANFWYILWIDPINHCGTGKTYTCLLDAGQSHCTRATPEGLKTYNKFLSQYHGGPLYFKLIMDSVVADPERVSSALLKHMTEYTIGDIKGEEVSHAVSLLCNGCDEPFSIHCLPQDMPRILVKVYQAKSNTESNKFLELSKLEMHQALSLVSCDVFAIQHHLVQNLPILMLHLQDQLKSKCDLIRGMVDVECVQMKYSGNWTLPKGHTAALTAAKPLMMDVLQLGVCWNCGKEGHLLGD